MSRFLSALILLGGLFLSGCSTAYYYAEFIKPSNRYIPSSLYVVGLADRSSIPEHTTPVYTDGIPYEYLEGVPEQTATITLNTLSKLVDDMGRYALVRVDVADSTISEKGLASRPLTPQALDSIGRLYGIDGLIALDDCEMIIRTSGDVNVVSVNDGAGAPVRVPEFSKESQVTLSLLWRFYDCRSGELLDEYEETYERVFGRVSYSEDEIRELKPKDLSLMDVAGMAAYDYYERISPHWEEGYRKYYYSGSAELQDIATELDYTGNWERAATRWKQLTTSENLKVRYRAMYNMAVASEILGKPKVAKEWIGRAIELDPSRQARAYAKEIDKQIVIYDVVNRQLGIQ